jgi:hypothetical protein
MRTVHTALWRRGRSIDEPIQLSVRLDPTQRDPYHTLIVGIPTGTSLEESAIRDRLTEQLAACASVLFQNF